MLMEVTRPIMARGVTVWRNVVEVMAQMIGPAPNKAANQTCGQYKVSAMVMAASTEKHGPSKMACPNGEKRQKALGVPQTFPWDTSLSALVRQRVTLAYHPQPHSLRERREGSTSAAAPPKKADAAFIGPHQKN
jgi:hypothetical protein